MALIKQQPVNIMSDNSVLTVTPAAISVIKSLLEQRNIPNHALRVFVTGGGCSGMQYGMSFQEKADEGDTVVMSEDVRLLVDQQV